MQVLEGTVERRFCHLVNKRLGCLVVKLNFKGHYGWPDRMVLAPGGRALFVELKHPGKKPNPLQGIRLRTLKNLGFFAEVHDDADSAFRAVRRALAAARQPT